MTNKSKLIKLILTTIMLIIGVGSIFPFIFMVSSTFKVSGEVLKVPFSIIPEHFTLDNIKGLFVSGYYDFIGWYKNTIVMTGITLLIKLFFVSYTAYGFAKINFKGRETIFLVLLAALMIPSDIMILPRYIIFKNLSIINTMWALILPACVDVYFVFLLRQAFIAIPDSLVAAAKIDGSSHYGIFFKIFLPLGKPAIATMMLFSFVWSWNDYMGPYLYISDIKKQMLSVGIKLFSSGQVVDYGIMMAGATLVILPILIIFTFCQRYFIEGVASSGIKG